jgi:ABC-2 type transport system permease protein
VAWKEWLIFRRYPSWIMAILIWPILFPFVYIFTARALSGPHGSTLPAFARAAGTTDYVSFIVVGTVLWMWLNMTLWDMGYFLRNEQMHGTLESNWLCPVWRISIMLGASLTKLATSVLFLGLTVLEFGLLLGVRLVRGNIPLLMLLFLLMLPIIYGIGLVFGSLVIRFKEANAMVFLVRGIFMVFCGITYPLAVLPPWMQGVAYVLPLTYAIRDIRAAALADAGIAAVAPDLVRLAAFAVLLPAIGVIAFSLMECRARRTGTLGQY